MANGQIRVRLRAFDVELIDQSAKSIVQTVQKAGPGTFNFHIHVFLQPCVGTHVGTPTPSSEPLAEIHGHVSVRFSLQFVHGAEHICCSPSV